MGTAILCHKKIATKKKSAQNLERVDYMTKTATNARLNKANK